MNPVQEIVRQIANEHGVNATDWQVSGVHTSLSFSCDGLPQLPFFIRIAQELIVPLECISVYHMKGMEGCDTCGYGGECQFDITVRWG